MNLKYSWKLYTTIIMATLYSYSKKMSTTFGRIRHHNFIYLQRKPHIYSSNSNIGQWKILIRLIFLVALLHMICTFLAVTKYYLKKTLHIISNMLYNNIKMWKKIKGFMPSLFTQNKIVFFERCYHCIKIKFFLS